MTFGVLFDLLHAISKSVPSGSTQPNDGEMLRSTAAAARLKLAEEALAPFEAVYQELQSLWANLETKAQGSTAVAGVFLGATISILTRDGVLDDTQKTLIITIASALAVAVILALLALVPRHVPLVKDPEHRFRRVRDLLLLEDDKEFLSLLTDFYLDEKDQWVEALSTFQRMTKKKARFLFLSHSAVAVAIIAAVLLVVSMVSLGGP